MVAFEEFEDLVVEGLDAKADAGDAVLFPEGEALGGDVEWVGFEAEFPAGLEGEPGFQEGEELCGFFGGEVGGGASAEEESVYGTGRIELTEVEIECVEVAGDEMVFAGDEGEVAVSAAVAAEGDVDVGGGGGIEN